MGRLAYDLGNTYSAVGVEPPNSSALFWIMQWPIAKVREYSLVSADAFQRTLDAIDQAMHELGEARMMRSDAGLITREFETAAGMLRHACRRGLFALDPGAVSRAALDQELQDLMRVYESNWLARNRPGGLSDSLARFEIARADYRNL
jgi:hypothetical protein